MIATTTKRCALLMLVGALAYARPAVAAETAAASTADDAAARAALSVTVVHATHGDGGVDPALAPLAKYLERSFAQYRAFKRLAAHELAVDRDKTRAVALPNGLKLALTYRGVDKGFVKLGLELDTLKTTVNVKNGGLFFQAGRVHRGVMLVLAIRARSEPTKPE